jgi:phosphoribosylglycinamide formyltransferase-1
MRLTVFASGGGTNFQRILDAIDQGRLDAEPVGLITNRADAGARERAERHGIPADVVDPDAFSDPADFGRALLDLLGDRDTSFVALAGFMRKIPANVVDAYRGAMVNIHPALLPAFGGKGMYGMNVHRAVIEYGVHWSGATVHLVDEAYDHGPIVLQEPVPVYPDDTPESLAERVLAVEHRIYPKALQLFAENRIRRDDRRVRILPPS